MCSDVRYSHFSFHGKIKHLSTFECVQHNLGSESNHLSEGSLLRDQVQLIKSKDFDPYEMVSIQ